METYTVTAENAPIGIQLWPTRLPKYADNFTLATVTTDNDLVTWTYRNGNTRTFRRGEQVACAKVA